LLRLTRALTELYNNPPIICHHNFTMCPLDQGGFPAGCRFLKPHLNTRWGDISLVKAGLLAIDRLLQMDGWDWFFLLSGSDYPIAKRESVSRELVSAKFDALIDNRLVQYDARAVEGPDVKGQFTFSRPYWRSLAYDRYLSYQVPYLSLTRRFARCTRWLRIRS